MANLANIGWREMKRGMIMKLKRIGSIVLAIVIILLLLVIGVTPIAATGNGEPNGDNCDGAPGGGPCGTFCAYAGQFLAGVCGSYAGYNWVGGWQQGNTLAGPVSQVGTCYCSPGTTYKLEIPEGTVIEGYYGGRVNHIEFWIIGGQLYFSPNLKLSQPATLYKLVDGEWIEVLTFTQVLSGKAS